MNSDKGLLSSLGDLIIECGMSGKGENVLYESLLEKLKKEVTWETWVWVELY
jgi:hypothetical protein